MKDSFEKNIIWLQGFGDESSSIIITVTHCV